MTATNTNAAAPRIIKNPTTSLTSFRDPIGRTRSGEYDLTKVFQRRQEEHSVTQEVGTGI